MKLPEITYSAAARPNSLDPSAALSKHRGRQSITDAVFAAGEAVAGKIVADTAREDEAEAARVDAARNIRLSEIETERAELDTYTREDLERWGVEPGAEGITWQTPDGEDIQNFKPYEVDAAIVANTAENTRKEFADKISNTELRDSWSLVIEEENAARVLAAAKSAKPRRKAAEYKQAIAELESMPPGPRAEYAALAPALDSHPEVKAKIIRQAKAEEFDTTANELFNNGTDKQIEAFIEGVKDRETRAKLPVTENQVRLIQNRGEGELKQRAVERGDYNALAEKEHLALAKGKYEQIRAAYSAGITVPGAALEDAKDAVRGTQYEEPLARADRVGQFSLLNAETRQEQLAFTNNFDSVEDHAAMKVANDALQRAALEDGYRLAVDQGIADFVPIDLDNPGSVKDRKRQAEMAGRHYGVPISPFTQDEVALYSSELPQMTPAEQSQMAMAFQSTPEAWSQFAKSGAGVFAQVGASGDMGLALEALTGQQMIDSKQVIPPTRNDLLIASNDYLGNVYGIEDKQQIIDTATALYAANAPVGNEGEFDEDVYLAALESATGGVSEINGNKVAIPRNTDPDLLQDYVDGFTPEQVASFGGVDGMSHEAAADLIQNAPWASEKDGVYRVINGNQTLFSKGKPFLIRYDTNTAKDQKSTEYSQSAESRRKATKTFKAPMRSL